VRRKEEEEEEEVEDQITNMNRTKQNKRKNKLSKERKVLKMTQQGIRKFNDWLYKKSRIFFCGFGRNLRLMNLRSIGEFQRFVIFLFLFSFFLFFSFFFFALFC
jgi:hypothetical protein